MMIGDKPALIIHSKGDSQVPYPSFERIVKAAPDHVEKDQGRGFTFYCGRQ